MTTVCKRWKKEAAAAHSGSERFNPLPPPLPHRTRRRHSERAKRVRNLEQTQRATARVAPTPVIAGSTRNLQQLPCTHFTPYKNKKTP